MVDIHTHILPAVDDGSRNLDESLRILERAEAIGIREMSASPHVYDMEFAPDYLERIDRAMSELREAVETRGIKLVLHQGYEIYLTDRTARFLETHDLSYNAKGKHVLIEMPMNQMPAFLPDTVFELKLRGVTPIIAHPERNADFERNKNLLERALDIGALIQMDAASLTGGFGEETKKNARTLLAANAVHIAASDVHNTTSRSVELLAQARQAVLDISGDEAYVQTLFSLNPAKAVRGEEILTYPISLKAQSYSSKNWFSRLLDKLS